jgi:hypothetical protein
MQNCFHFFFIHSFKGLVSILLQTSETADKLTERMLNSWNIRAGIFKKSMGARHRGGIGFSYRPARLHRLAEFIPWHQFRGPIHI